MTVRKPKPHSDPNRYCRDGCIECMNSGFCDLHGYCVTVWTKACEDFDSEGTAASRSEPRKREWAEIPQPSEIRVVKNVSRDPDEANKRELECNAIHDPDARDHRGYEAFSFGGGWEQDSPSGT